MGWQVALGAAAGEVLGGLLQGGSDGIDVSENVRLNEAMRDIALDSIGPFTDRHIGAITGAAKKYGYHPMYLMGQSKGFTPTTVIGGGPQGGPDYAGIGSRLGQAAGEYFTESKRKQTASEKAMGLRMQQAQVRNVELDAELKYAEIMRMKQEMNGVRHTGGNPTDGGAQTFGAAPMPIPVRINSKGQKEIRHSDGVWRVVRNPNIVKAGEDDYGEGIEMEAVTNYINDVAGPMLAREFRKATKVMGPSAAMKMLWDFLRPGWDKAGKK